MHGNVPKVSKTSLSTLRTAGEMGQKSTLLYRETLEYSKLKFHEIKSSAYIKSRILCACRIYYTQLLFVYGNFAGAYTAVNECHLLLVKANFCWCSVCF